MSRTLLLADDSVTIQKVVGISFANEDIVLLTVDNGDDAVARAREARPDAVLADVVMPGKNGYEVCEAIKSDPDLRHIPVLLLTGTFEPFDEDRARSAGADGHITKPFEAQALVDQVNALFERSSPTPAAEPVEAAPPEAVSAGEAPQAYDFFDDDLSEEARAREASLDEAELELGPGDEALELETAVEEGAPEGALGETELFGAEAEAGTPEPVQGQDSGEEPNWRIAGGTPGEADLAGLGAPLGLDTKEREEPSRPLGVALEPPVERALEPPPVEQAVEPPPVEQAVEPPVEQAAEPLAPPAFAERERPEPGGPTAEWDDTTGGRPFDLGFVSEPEPSVDTQPVPLAEAVAERSTDAVAGDAPLAAELPSSEDPLAELEPDELAGEAVLDPEAARDHDVSVSDLGDPLADLDTPTARPVTLQAPAPPEPMSAPAVLESDSLTGPAAMAPRTGAIPEEATPGAAAASAPAPTAAGLSRELEQRLHESLEKVAWESFGDLSERIVRETVLRVEAIAWEVIPQMAETLIREEIRRLKGDDESER